jgi:hypothetical protein
MATKLILSANEANNYVRYLTGISKELTGSSTMFIGLGNMADGVFTEITPDAGNNYARTMTHSTGSYPDVLSVDGRRVYNHEQIVFNKVLETAYTANAIGLYRLETGGSPYAFGLLEEPLNAVVGSLPLFERNQLQIIVPDGTEAE